MIKEKQRTIKESVSFSGIGVHTGKTSSLTFKPAKENSGITFIRTDIPDKPFVKASVDEVVEVLRGTTIGNKEKAHIHTVEHALAAITGCGIDNIIIEVSDSEPPVADGSSLPFVELLKKAGIVEQNEDRVIYELKEKIVVCEGDSYLIALPDKDFKISYTVAFKDHKLNAQYLSLIINEDTFQKQIAPSRTFCFYREVEALMDQGLIKGGSLDNAVVIGDDAIFSKESLRFEDEFVRHKMLDLIGDLTLLGGRIKAHIIAVKSGHSLNVKLATELKKIFKKDQGSINKQKELAMENKEGFVLDINEIQQVLPHRYPFLLVDRILELNDDGAVGLKNVTVNEQFFNGHFPGHPIMPGVLQLEAMAQVAGVMMLRKNENEKKLAYFMSIENARFRKPVYPGDQLRMEIKVIKLRSRTGKVSAKALVNGEVASEAELTFALVDK